MSIKRWEQRDRYQSRERQKYPRPIPSREYLLEHLAEVGVPMTRDRLAEDLGLKDETDLEALTRRLNAMVRDGQLVRNRRANYLLVDRRELVPGRVMGHPDGFGFLVPDAGGQDIYLPPRQMRRLLHRDRAVVRVVGTDRRGRPEGALVEVLERHTHRVVGRFLVEGGVALLVPHNARLHQDIIVPAEHRNGAVHGQIVVVELLQQPDQHSPPVGKVIEILGDHMAPGMEIELAIRAYELPHVFPPALGSELSAMDTEVPDAAMAGREDLRDVPLVTIDGADARDFDDAVFCERHGRGWRLLVAIADVASYVSQGSALDAEARNRGNSVYFPDRVLPMLPEHLSNGLCSLNPGVDRLCLVCEMFVTPSGTVRRFRFFEGVMRSAGRLIYEEVDAALKGNPDAVRSHAKLLMHLKELHGLYQVLRAARDKRGAIDFDTVETRIIFGRDRKIRTIVPVERTDAHRIIEECMIAANVCAAQFLQERELQALYRNHEGPPEDKVAELREFLGELGLRLGGAKRPAPKHFAQLMAETRDRPDAHLIQTVMLRSLSQAIYGSETKGHFGLALKTYTHFTSPIRRYPDLVVHRAIRHCLSGRPAHELGVAQSELETLGEHCSMTERRADEATRDAVDWLKCEYMMGKVGEVFDGIISGVAPFGIFVELEGIYVQGLVHVTSLGDDYYHFDATRHRLWGDRTRQTYRLADRVQVRVVRVSLDERKIDFELRRQTTRKSRRRKAP